MASELTSELAWLPSLNGIFISTEDYEGGLRRLPDGMANLLPDTAAFDPDDPLRGQWGGSPTANGRVLEARISELAPTWFDVELTVSSTSNEPLAGVVSFHLHPTLQPSLRPVKVVDGAARLRLQMWGASTVGVSADEGRTRLELDLAAIPGAPEWFRLH
jgi:hypothetical protein